MKYFAFNGSSPHTSMWKKSGGDLRYAGRLNPASLIGIRIDRSVIDDIARGKILEKFPYLDIPLMEEKIIEDVQVGEHIICFSTINGKYVSPRLEEDDDLIIEDYVVVSQQYLI